MSAEEKPDETSVKRERPTEDDGAAGEEPPGKVAKVEDTKPSSDNANGEAAKKTEDEAPPPVKSEESKPTPTTPLKDEPAFSIDRAGDANAASATPVTTYNAPPPATPNPEQTVEERGTVSALYVGKVIGKGGEMIRDLQARSGARIDVDQNVPPGQPRVITYRGSRKTVDYAKMLVQMLSQDGVTETDLPLGQARREVLVIPAPAVGKVIGRGGEMIRELQSRSQAKIQVDHSGASGIPVDKKQVTIIGTEIAVIKAKEMIQFLVNNPMMDALQAINMLIDDKVRGSTWGSGPPYPNLPNQGYNMQPEMVSSYGTGSYPHGGYGAGSHHHGAGGGGFGGPPGGMGGGGYQQPPPPHGGMPYGQPKPQGGGYGQYGGGGGGATEVDVTYAQKQYMGRIIGQKGVTVNDLQRRSGCDIQINQNVPVGSDCEITIRGNRAGIEQAKHMIREIIEIGPAHPYAGGAEHGGHGGSHFGGGGYGGGGSGGGGGGGYGHHQPPQQGGYDYSQQQQPYGGYQQPPQPPHQGYGYGQQQQGGYGQQPPPMQQQQQQPYGGGYGQQQQPPYGGGAGGSGYGGPPAAAVAPAPPPPPPPQATSTWKSTTAPDGQVYYYNEATGETQWDKPAGMM